MTKLEVAAAILIGVNVIASIRVLLDRLSTGHQKFLQLLFVWLVPIAGAVMTFSVRRQTTPRRTALIGSALLPSWFTVLLFGVADAGAHHSSSDFDGGSSHGGDGSGGAGSGGGGGDG